MPAISKESSKRTRTPNVKRLEFFSDFLASCGLTYENVATILGMTHPSIWRAINVADDTRISYIYKVVESQGYTIAFSLMRESDLDNEEVFVSGDDFRYAGGGWYKLRRTAFITAALKRYGISKLALAETLGLQYSSIRNWFSEENDDIYFSRVVNIAEKLDFNIVINITKPTNDKLTTVGKTRIITYRSEEKVQVIGDSSQTKKN